MAEDTFLERLTLYANSQLIKARDHEVAADRLTAGIDSIPRKNPGAPPEKIQELVANVQSQIDAHRQEAAAASGRAASANKGFFRAAPGDRKTFTAADHQLYSEAMSRGVCHTDEKPPAKKK
jgi:hypothetical protein